MFDKAITKNSTMVKERPSFKKIPNIKNTGARIVHKICNEIICFVIGFRCFNIWERTKGAIMLSGGKTINNMEEILISLTFPKSSVFSGCNIFGSSLSIGFISTGI